MKRLLLLSFMLLMAVSAVAQSRVTGRVLIGGFPVVGATVVATTEDEARMGKVARMEHLLCNSSRANMI